MRGNKELLTSLVMASALAVMAWAQPPQPRPGDRGGPGGPGRGAGPRSAGFENAPLPKDDAERKILEELKGPIDMVVIDADKEGYLDYLNKTLPLVWPGGLIVAHNMIPRMASADFVKAITTNPELETVFCMEGAGVSVTMKKR